MVDMNRIEEVEELLEEIVLEIPQEFFNGLNGGIVLSEEKLYHPEAKNNDLLIMGQYKRDFFGSTIVIYYGSIMSLYAFYDRESLKEILRETLLHEFTHHLEYLGGEKGLIIKDEIQMEKYRSEN